MKKLFTLVAVLAAALAVSVSPAGAVKYGTPDVTNAYPWVGLMVAVDPAGEPLWRCTGSLLSANLFLTAGHCVGEPQAAPADQPASVRIWFTNQVIVTDPVYLANLAKEDEQPGEQIDLCAGVTGYPCGGYDAVGTPLAHPNWNGSLTIPQTSDVGIVTNLIWTGTMPTSFGTLAPVGYLDNLAYEQGKGNVEFTVVGFGLQSVKPVQSAIKQRMIGTVSLVNLNSALAGGWNLHYSNNPGQGHDGSGGTCFGDSGGPVIHNGYIVAVNSFVLNSNCQGAGFGYRVDTTYAQNFILAPR